MTGQINFFNRRCFLIFALCLISVSGALADNRQLVAQNLSERLKSDLGNENVAVKLNKVEERVISKSAIGLTGNAVCVLTEDNQQLPIQFEATINPANRSVLEVKYDFVAEADFAPSQNEEVLMKELMKEISRDYKTQNIVIAIDAFETVGGANKFLGVGEVRIGDMVWNRIKFDVVFDEQTRKASRVVYKIEK